MVNKDIQPPKTCSNIPNWLMVAKQDFDRSIAMTVWLNEKSRTGSLTSCSLEAAVPSYSGLIWEENRR